MTIVLLGSRVGCRGVGYAAHLKILVRMLPVGLTCVLHGSMRHHAQQQAACEATVIRDTNRRNICYQQAECEARNPRQNHVISRQNHVFSRHNRVWASVGRVLCRRRSATIRDNPQQKHDFVADCRCCWYCMLRIANRMLRVLLRDAHDVAHGCCVPRMMCMLRDACVARVACCGMLLNSKMLRVLLVLRVARVACCACCGMLRLCLGFRSLHLTSIYGRLAAANDSSYYAVSGLTCFAVILSNPFDIS